jgi:hypothetical protein
MKPTIVIALSLAMAMSSALGAKDEWSMSWCEVAPMATGNKVLLELADGEKVRGQALKFDDDSLRILVIGSSEPVLYPPDQSVSVDRDNILAIRIRRHRQIGRVIGTTAGVAGGLFVGAAVGYVSNSAPAFIGAWIGTAVAGYALGDASDRKVSRVHLRSGDNNCEEIPELTRNSPESPEGDTTRPQVGLEGTPSYAVQKGANDHAKSPAGSAGSQWGSEQRSGHGPPPAEPGSESYLVPNGVSETEALR